MAASLAIGALPSNTAKLVLRGSAKLAYAKGISLVVIGLPYDINKTP